MSGGIFVYCDRNKGAGRGHKGRVPVWDFPRDKPNWGLPKPAAPVSGAQSGQLIHPIRKKTLTCSRCGFSVRADVRKLAAVLDELVDDCVSLADLAAKL